MQTLSTISLDAVRLPDDAGPGVHVESVVVGGSVARAAEDTAHHVAPARMRSVSSFHGVLRVCLGLEGEDVHLHEQAVFVIVWVQRVRVDVFLQRSHGE